MARCTRCSTASANRSRTSRSRQSDVTGAAMIKGLHHNAYRCRDSEETRRFYEDFLGLPLVHTLHIEESKTGRETDALHIFFQLDDGSCLALFEVPGRAFE